MDAKIPEPQHFQNAILYFSPSTSKVSITLASQL